MDDTDYAAYNPHPYSGGYDQAKVYGKPNPPSERTCYPRSPVDNLSFPPYDYGSEASAYGGEEIDQKGPKTDVHNGSPVHQEETRDYDWGSKRNGDFDYIEFGYQNGEEWKPNYEIPWYSRQDEEPSYNYDIPFYPHLEEQPGYNYDTPVYPHLEEQSSSNYDIPKYYGYDIFNYRGPPEPEESYQSPEDISTKVIDWLFSGTTG